MSHIHTPSDGRGPREVFLNGQKVDGVFFADTRKGKIVRHVMPYKIHRHGKRTITRTNYGKVEVLFPLEQE